MISASDRVAAVLARDERLIDVFIEASPAFEKLRNTAMRKTMAKLVTVEQAAKIAGIDAGVLVEHLNRALEGARASAPPLLQKAAQSPELAAPIPDALLATSPEHVVDLDVREDLRAGREPFVAIMSAARALPAGSVLRVRAIFEPVPLYAVLGKLGLAHATERLADDDFRVWFYRDAAAPAGQPKNPEPASAGPTPEGDVIVLDVRGLDPPEPMVRTLAALSAMPRGKTLVQLNERVPQLLLPKLRAAGFVYEIREQSADLVRVFIRHS